jgi:hypothetical protein
LGNLKKGLMMVSQRPLEEERCRLRVAAGAEWFKIGDSAPVLLETRLPLRRLLLALADLRANSPNAVLPVTAAFDAGWPGERASPTAAAMRVYTAVHSLRRLGLRGLLVRRRRGYVLDADVSIVKESLMPPALTESQVTDTVPTDILTLSELDIANTG